MNETEIKTTEKEIRTKTIQIRVSPSEYAILESLADERHLSIGTFVRSEMLRRAPKDAEPIAE